jgi:hypothetical protein
VFDIKPGYEGVDERQKARLVALGCSQLPCIDYDQTFAPVVKLTTFRVHLAMAVSGNLEILQIDVKTAFLHGRKIASSASGCLTSNRDMKEWMRDTKLAWLP